MFSTLKRSDIGLLHKYKRYNSLSIELYTESVFEQKLDYIHENPIKEKWKLANLVEEYKYSSASFYYGGNTEFDFLSHYKD